MAQQALHVGFESEVVPRDESHVLRVVATERMSRPYRVEVDLAIPDALETGSGDFLGTDGSVVLEDRDGATRHLHGVVTEAEELPDAKGHRCFRLVLRPHAWLATLVSTSELYLDEAVPDVVVKKLEAVLAAPPTRRLSGTYAPREIITQYGESDHAFASRLCEHVGIFYFFEHGDAGEQVVLGDDATAYGRVAVDDGVPFDATGSNTSVFELRERQAVVPALYVCRDYNYRAPQLDVSGEHRLEAGLAGGVIEYGGHVRSPEQAKALARVRADEQATRHAQYFGRSTDVRFAPGHTFRVSDHPRHAQRLVLIEVEHEVHQAFFDDAGKQAPAYTNRFVAIPADVTYRPPRETPIPRVEGFVTGIVETGQGDIESYAKIDDQGRYTVSFLFDAGGADRVRASAPVRMVQPSAGPGYGVHFPLKPGVEVVVAFVDGNVDRPIIVGALPNPITPTPVALADSTASRILTRSGILIEFEDADRRA